MKSTNTLQLFNAVVSQNKEKNQPYISSDGYIIDSGAFWAKDEIIDFFNKEKLNGNDLNKSFHKSWKTIIKSSREELVTEQINHYISTYGSNFSETIYIPDEILEIPNIKLQYKVIKSYTKKEMIDKCLSMLRSGIAMQEETVDKIISILVDELSYKFTGEENIKNKEAIVKIADLYNILPKETMEFFRYIIYKTTGDTLIIKDKELIDLIKDSKYNPSVQFKEFGLEKLAEIFNRFKPLFLAFKNRSPKVINKISKLSKKYHKPLISNPLNEATSKLLTENEKHWLDNATPYALFKALSSCYTRMNGQDTFVYRVRNGKSWTKENKISDVNEKNYNFILSYMKERFNFSGKKFYFPKNIKFSLPTSEKMFVGNIPTGTKFIGKKLAVGVYWEDSWGANDLDLSGMNIGGKIGWNSDYKQGKNNLIYSGDITSAPNGAVEYLYANKGLSDPTLVCNNVFSGASDCEFKIIIGKGDSIDKNYMMNPNKLFSEVKVKSVQAQSVLGIIIPNSDKQEFVLLNFGIGHARVSDNSELSNLSTKALYQQWSDSLSFNKIIKKLGATLVKNPEDSDYNFSIDNLEKDSFIKIFKNI